MEANVWLPVLIVASLIVVFGVLFKNKKKT